MQKFNNLCYLRTKKVSFKSNVINRLKPDFFIYIFLDAMMFAPVSQTFSIITCPRVMGE